MACPAVGGGGGICAGICGAAGMSSWACSSSCVICAPTCAACWLHAWMISCT